MKQVTGLCPRCEGRQVVWEGPADDPNKVACYKCKGTGKLEGYEMLIPGSVVMIVPQYAKVFVQDPTNPHEISEAIHAKKFELEPNHDASNEPFGEYEFELDSFWSDDLEADFLDWKERQEARSKG